MFVGRKIKQTLLRKFGKVFFYSPFRFKNFQIFFEKFHLLGSKKELNIQQAVDIFWPHSRPLNRSNYY